MPPGWRLAGEFRFTAYYYGELMLRLYTRDVSGDATLLSTTANESAAAAPGRAD